MLENLSPNNQWLISYLIKKSKPVLHLTEIVPGLSETVPNMHRHAAAKSAHHLGKIELYMLAMLNQPENTELFDRTVSSIKKYYLNRWRVFRESADNNRNLNFEQYMDRIINIEIPATPTATQLENTNET